MIGNLINNLKCYGVELIEFFVIVENEYILISVVDYGEGIFDD